MKELVFITPKGNPVTNSLLIAEKFKKRHSDVLRAIDNLSCSNEFRQRNFAPVENQLVGSAKEKYFVTTKSGFVFLVMGFTGKQAGQFKEDYINAFDKMEESIKRLSKSPEIPQSYPEALELAAKQARQLEAKEKEIKQLEPKASYAERVLEQDNQKVDIGQAAKLLKLPFGRNTFFKKLKDDGIFFKSRNEPKQEYLHYFDLRKEEITRKNHPAFVVLKVLVNPNGLYWLSKRYGGEYNLSIPEINIQ